MWSSVGAVQQAQLALVARKTEKHMQHCLQASHINHSRRMNLESEITWDSVIKGRVEPKHEGL